MVPGDNTCSGSPPTSLLGKTGPGAQVAALASKLSQLPELQGLKVLPFPAGEDRSGHSSGQVSFTPPAEGKKLSHPLGLQGLPVLSSPDGEERTGRSGDRFSFLPPTGNKKLCQPLGLQVLPVLLSQAGEDRTGSPISGSALHLQLERRSSPGCRPPVYSKLLGTGSRLQATCPAKLLAPSQRRKPFGHMGRKTNDRVDSLVGKSLTINHEQQGSLTCLGHISGRKLPTVVYHKNML
uniref:Uncharacterized protein n=1 Tax=Sphaerodactylus townsendi TaxID=933632 RepID=A0ACB8FFM7_9SAUR